MNLFSIVDYVNMRSSKELFSAVDSEMSFSTNSTSSSVCSELPEVLVMYRREPDSITMVNDLLEELERRKTIIEFQISYLEDLEASLCSKDDQTSS